MYTLAEIQDFLSNVCDPEVPVLNVLDLGIVRDIQITEQEVSVVITPTYSGCPAMHTIAQAIQFELISRGISNVKVKETLSPPWTTDWMTIAGKEKLKKYGIAPPQYNVADNEFNEKKVECPLCNSLNTVMISQFGSTACKALYKCNDCLEPFDYFKCH